MTVTTEIREFVISQLLQFKSELDAESIVDASLYAPFGMNINATHIDDLDFVQLSKKLKVEE